MQWGGVDNIVCGGGVDLRQGDVDSTAIQTLSSTCHTGIDSHSGVVIDMPRENRQ